MSVALHRHAKAGPQAAHAGLRVLFVTNSWPDHERPWHGIAMKNEVDALRALGFELDVLSIRGYASRAAYFRAAARVAAIARQGSYDIVHAQYGHSGVVGRMQLSAPLVISYLGSDLLAVHPALNGLTRRAQVEALVFRELARVAAATITQSEEMERILPASCRRRNHVIADGVDLTRFRPAPRAEARRALGWPDDELVVLFAADPARREKNYPLAAAACRLLLARMPQATLRVAAGVDPGAVPLWMSAADALLMTSFSEGGPTTVKEAMAVELPVVSTPVGIVRECLRGMPGLWVAPADAEALAGALREALAGGRVPEARDAISTLSWERVAERIARVYEAVARP